MTDALDILTNRDLPEELRAQLEDRLVQTLTDLDNLRADLEEAVQATRDLTGVTGFDPTPTGVVDAWMTFSEMVAPGRLPAGPDGDPPELLNLFASRAAAERLRLQVAELLQFARAGAEVNSLSSDLARTLLARIEEGEFGDGRIGECGIHACTQWAVQAVHGKLRCFSHRERV